MGLIDIPPYVLANEDPPNSRALVRAFHLACYQVLPPPDFPRELFTDVLAEHARLLEHHSADILAAPLDHPIGATQDTRFVELDELHWTSALLVSDGTRHEIHRWPAVDLSFVVHRCRGIVRTLMEAPSPGFMHVVVVARDVASLHLVRGVAPRRGGDVPRIEVVERDRAVEPWDQWHRRERDFVTTWWRTPAGDLVASRVRVRPWPSTANQVADALVAVYEPALRRRLAAHAQEYPRERRFAVLDACVNGDEIEVIDRRHADGCLRSFPAILEAVRSGPEGFVPVFVSGYSWGALRWLPTAQPDVAVPPSLTLKRPRRKRDDEDDDPQASGGGPKPEPKPQLSPGARLQALLDDFPPIDPWAPRAKDVHGAWQSGLLLAALAGMVVAAAFVLVGSLEGSIRGPWWVAALLLILAAAGCGTMGAVLRHYLLAIDPVRRERRWKAWKQVNDELEAARHPKKPAPPVQGRKYWMRKLTERLSRLERLVSLSAPDIIIDGERKLVRDAIAELDASDADAILRAWPAAAKHVEPGRRRAKPKEKPN